MKKICLFLLSLILLTSLVFATTSIEGGTSWLLNNTDWNEDIESVVFSTLVLDLGGHSSEAQIGLTKLQDRKDSENCWSKKNCKIKETALGLLALDYFDKSTSKIVDWLYDAQIPALKTGDFWIQAASDTDGECVLTYDGESKTFTIQDGKILECHDKPWIDVNCIERNFIKDSLSREVNVDCTSLMGDVVISLIYQLDNDFYLLQEEHSSTAVIKIDNACFGSSESSTTCDYKSTLFASWVLSQVNENVNTLPYLASKTTKSDSTLGYSLLYLITKKSVYLSWLEEYQSASGNFGDVYTTAFANLALKDRSSAENSTDWLKLRQRLDGSWNGNMRDTSVVLHSLLGGIEARQTTERACIDYSYKCCDSCKEGFEQSSYDDTCFTGEVCCEKCEYVVKEETCINQGYGCCDACDGEFEYYSGYDGTCDYDEVCCEKCEYIVEEDEEIEVLTTYCGDDTCDIDEDKKSCPQDCKRFPVWLIVILIMILLIVGLLLVYQKFFKGKLPTIFKKEKLPRKKPSKIPPQRPAYPARRPSLIKKRPPIKSKIEDELEKSLAEAKKLLGGSKKTK